MNSNFIVNATDAYLESYNRVMEKTKNPNMAMNVATSVCGIYMMTFKEEQKAAQHGANMLGALFAAIAQGNQQDKEDEDGDETE